MDAYFGVFISNSIFGGMFAMNLALSKQLILYAITVQGTELKTLLRQVDEALSGGATILQLREKNIDDDEYYCRAFEVKKICDRHRVPLIIDDSVEVALRCDAAGLHIGQQDISLEKARKLLGPEKIIGVSTKTVEQARRAEDEGADYLGVGAIYQTTTKENPIYTSVDTLKNICEAVSIPVVAIGGIKLHNLLPLKDSGIVGIAVVTGIFSAPDVRKAAYDFRLKVEELSLR